MGREGAAASATIKRGYVPAGRAQVHYRRAGKPEAPLLVLLHQTPSTSAMYEPLMALLAGHFDLIAPDTPGFGQSDAIDGPFSVASAASALAAAVRWIRPGPAFWFGHHTGAALALQVAVTHPEQVSLLAMSGPCLLDAPLREKLAQVAVPVAPSDDGAHARLIWDRINAKDPAAPLAVRERDALAGIAAGKRYPEAYAAVMEVDTAAQIKALACPTLVFAGTDDILHPPLEAAFRMLKKGRKAEIPHGRSFVCERNAPEVAALLTHFFGEKHG